jgi:anti-sigma factor RsiW
LKVKHQRLHELCEAYALGALNDNEREQLESHLQSGCEECTKKLAELQRVGAALGFSVAAVAPPPELKQKILDHMASEAPSPFYFVRAGRGPVARAGPRRRCENSFR